MSIQKRWYSYVHTQKYRWPRKSYMPEQAFTLLLMYGQIGDKEREARLVSQAEAIRRGVHSPDPPGESDRLPNTTRRLVESNTVLLRLCAVAFNGILIAAIPSGTSGTGTPCSTPDLLRRDVVGCGGGRGWTATGTCS